MCKEFALTAAITLLLLSPAYSGDLYVLGIKDEATLTAVKGIVPNAYGMIGDKFIVELNPEQFQRLDSVGIKAEFVAYNFIPERFFIVGQVGTPGAPKGVLLTACYQSAGAYIVDLRRGEIDILRQEGYMVIPMKGKKTPFFYKPEVANLRFLDTYPSDSLADLVSLDSLYSYDSRLAAFKTRYMFSDSINSARDWIMEKFLSFGYTDLKYDTFYTGFSGDPDKPLHNVICIKPGVTHPEKLIVVGAHYDSYNMDEDPMLVAFGADDNASGTSGVLELARIFKDVTFDKTIIFTAFSGEEEGLYGSEYMAAEFYEQQADIEVMINMDMIGYDPDSNYKVELGTGTFPGYAFLMIDAAQRVTNLETIYVGPSAGSDEISFSHMGYNVVLAIEPNPRLNPNYHHSSDIPANINFEYMTRIVRMITAGVGQVENMPSAVAIDHIYDVGDGQSLQVVWESSCQPDYLYKVLYGIQSGVYTDTVDLPAGECIYNIMGLTEGQNYYIAVMPINAGGHSSVVLKESIGVSLVNPRVPLHFTADPDTGRIILTWRPNQELDINHYRLLRKDTVSSWGVLADNLIDTVFIDNSPKPHMAYGYSLIAVDNQGNESQGSPVSNAVMATFDGGILFVDETRSGAGNPTEAQQTAYYDSIFAGIPYFEYDIDNIYIGLNRSLAGQYSSIFWIDDDLASKQLAGSLDSLQWYLGYNGNLFLAGLGTFDWISGATSFLRNNFGILGVIGNQAGDFIEATGVNGWPSIQVGTGKLFSGAIPCIATFDTLPGAQVIYTYNSQSFNPALTGKPVGVAYDTPHGKRIALSFPIYYLTESSAQALIAKVLNYFGEVDNPQPYGDANGDGFVTMVDVLSLIDYLYRNGSLPSDLNYADANGDCVVNIRDITYIIRYLFKGGPAPMAGCVDQ